MYRYTFLRFLKNSSSVHVRCTCVTAVFCNYFNFPLVVLLRATRKSRGDITAEETWCTCLVACTCIRVYVQNTRVARHPLWPHSSFIRYLAFPFPLLHTYPVSVLLPSSLQPPSATCTCTRACTFVRVFERKRCARLVAVPCRCMQILSPKLVSAHASVLRTKAKEDEGARGKGSEGAINCGSSRGTVTGSRKRLRNCGCHDIDTSAPTSNVP